MCCVDCVRKVYYAQLFRQAQCLLFSEPSSFSIRTSSELVAMSGCWSDMHRGDEGWIGNAWSNRGWEEGPCSAGNWLRSSWDVHLGSGKGGKGGNYAVNEWQSGYDEGHAKGYAMGYGKGWEKGWQEGERYGGKSQRRENDKDEGEEDQEQPKKSTRKKKKTEFALWQEGWNKEGGADETIFPRLEYWHDTEWTPYKETVQNEFRRRWDDAKGIQDTETIEVDVDQWKYQLRLYNEDQIKEEGTEANKDVEAAMNQRKYRKNIGKSGGNNWWIVGVQERTETKVRRPVRVVVMDSTGESDVDYGTGA